MNGLEAPTIRIAMWSGPRNISTALLRSWGNRDDTFVCDEPLYGYYLKETERGHPGQEEIVAQLETDWRKVVDFLTGPAPAGKRVFYQKHMAHHLLPGIERDWLHRVTNAFLIRDPREMLLSLVRVMPDARLEDTGLPQQWEIFELVSQQQGIIPPVIDAKDVLVDPRGQLSALCRVLEVPFQETMLSWEAGPRPTDGIWARHWYAAVEASTGFEPYRPRHDQLPAHLEAIYQECLDYYNRLHAHRLRTPSEIELEEHE
jgi:hypothetical protein